MTESTTASRIEELVEEEHRLLRREEADSRDAEALADDRDRLAAVRAELDQCWDVLRRRRAARDEGDEQVSARSVDEIRDYLQ